MYNLAMNSAGKASVYMNRTIILIVAKSMSCSMMDGTVASVIEPKRSALKTGQQAASTAR